MARLMALAEAIAYVQQSPKFKRPDACPCRTGAGPVGATPAIELAWHGIASTVVDRAPHRVPPDHSFNFLWTEGIDRDPLRRGSDPPTRPDVRVWLGTVR
jgi:hypothetical protein